MIGRLLRITERWGQLIVKLHIAGSRQLIRAGRYTYRQFYRRRKSRLNLNSDGVEVQVRSLSSAIVVLLAAVGFLLLLATTPAVQGGVVGDIFNTPVPEQPPQTLPPVVAAPEDIEILDVGGTIIYSMLVGTQQDLFALPAGASEPIRLTNNPADDRYPVWSPDGGRIAFSSHRDGNWDLYVLDLFEGQTTRLTRNLAFESAPSWSPDGQWLTYEAYYEDNLDIYLIRADGSSEPIPVTHYPGADFSPAWTKDPSGREIAYVSTRNGNQDIYLISLDDPNEDRAINVTNTPNIDEDTPRWSPGGLLLSYHAEDEGRSLIYALSVGSADARPLLVGQGEYPVWSPDGGSILFLTHRGSDTLFLGGQYGDWNATIQSFILPGIITSPDWVINELPETPKGGLAFAMSAPLELEAYQESLWPPEDNIYRLAELDGVITGAAFLSDRVDGSFVALKTTINEAVGWDFLGRLDSVWWLRDRPVEPGQASRNWHKTGRAFDIVQTYNQSDPAQVEIVPRQDGPDLYWDIYIRAAVQDGTLGEPLRYLPWDFGARTSGDVQAYENGGKYKTQIPSGYYINFTHIARIYGWEPVATDSTWRYNWPGVLYWQYEKRDGLDWWSAMLELYTEAELQQTFFTPTPPPTIAVTPTPTIDPDDHPENAPTGTPTPTATSPVESK